MGNVGPVELILMLIALLVYMGGIAGVILGVMAFFKVRRLEKLVIDLETRIH